GSPRRPNTTARAVAGPVIDAVAHAVVIDAAARMELPAPPPHVRTVGDVAEAAMTRLDGSAFTAPAGLANDVVVRLDGWSKGVVDAERPRPCMPVDPLDSADLCVLSVLP